MGKKIVQRKRRFEPQMPVRADLLYSLPQELLTYIYSFDTTYRFRFTHLVLKGRKGLKNYDNDVNLWEWFMHVFVDRVARSDVKADPKTFDIYQAMLGLDVMEFDLKIHNSFYIYQKKQVGALIKNKFYDEYLEDAYADGGKKKYENDTVWAKHKKLMQQLKKTVQLFF